MGSQVSIVGTGNIAHGLALALHRAGVPVKHIGGRNTAVATELASSVGAKGVSIDKVDTSEGVILLGISDDAVQEVARSLPEGNAVVAHVSGGLPLDILPFENAGAMWPMFPFRKKDEIPPRNVLITISASNDSSLKQLVDIADNISDRVQGVSEEARRAMHVAAVLVNNFPNHLFTLAKDLLTRNNIDPSLIYPMIDRTAEDAKDSGDTQTGPAKRGEQIIIDAHEKYLEGDKDLAELYKVLTQSIRNRYQ